MLYGSILSEDSKKHMLLNNKKIGGTKNGIKNNQNYGR